MYNNRALLAATITLLLLLLLDVACSHVYYAYPYLHNPLAAKLYYREERVSLTLSPEYTHSG